MLWWLQLNMPYRNVTFSFIFLSITLQPTANSSVRISKAIDLL